MQAQKRICDIFGMDFRSAFAKYNLGAIPGILWAVMHDRKGNPPEDITLEEIGEMLTMEDVARCMGAIQSASEEGRVPKEQYEEDMNKTILAESQKASSGNGRFARNGLVLPMSSSGTGTPSEKLSIELSNTESSSENSTLVSA